VDGHQQKILLSSCKELVNVNCSYNSKEHKNKGAGMLMHSFACKYYFLIAILKGEPRRFEPRPHLKASRQTQLKVFLLSAAVHVILNGVVVTVLVFCAHSPSSNPRVVTNFFSTCFHY
jgi:hypothetical protein